VKLGWLASALGLVLRPGAARVTEPSKVARALVFGVGVLVLTLTAACARELPSTNPLGTGPLAGARHEPPSSATPLARTGGVEEDEDDNAPADQVTAVTADAGAADAQPAAALDATPKGESAAAGAVVSFAGDFRGKDVNVIRPEGGPAQPPIEDPNSRITVSEERDKRLAFTLYGEGGSVACTLYATPSGATAQFAAGQECIGGKLARGTARMDGDTLTLELVLDIELTLGDQSVRATIEYRFEGRRKK
jgi:hypothetical protein